MSISFCWPPRRRTPIDQLSTKRFPPLLCPSVLLGKRMIFFISLILLLFFFLGRGKRFWVLPRGSSPFFASGYVKGGTKRKKGPFFCFLLYKKMSSLQVQQAEFKRNFQSVSHAFTLDPQATYELFQVNPAAGLTDAQIDASRQKFGPNDTPRDPPHPLWQLILKQFEDTLVLILIGAALISLFLAFFEEAQDRKSVV